MSPEFRWAQRKDRVLITIDLQVDTMNCMDQAGVRYGFESEEGRERERRGSTSDSVLVRRVSSRADVWRGDQGVADESFAISNDGLFVFTGRGSYRSESLRQ